MSEVMVAAPGIASSTAQDERYQVYSRLDVVSILRQLAEKTEFATVYFGGSSDFVVSMVLAVNPQFEEIVMDLGADEAANERMLRAGRVLIVTQLDHIRIQFAADRAERITFGESPAFRVRLPSALMRLQRREYYRVRVPSCSRVRFETPAPEERGKPSALRVVDLSCGGIGLADLPAQLRCEPGINWLGCHLALPDMPTIHLDLEIVRIVESPTPGGGLSRRAGARFMNILDGTRAQLQRYVNRVERESLGK